MVRKPNILTVVKTNTLATADPLCSSSSSMEVSKLGVFPAVDGLAEGSLSIV